MDKVDGMQEEMGRVSREMGKFYKSKRNFGKIEHRVQVPCVSLNFLIIVLKK